MTTPQHAQYGWTCLLKLARSTMNESRQDASFIPTLTRWLLQSWSSRKNAGGCWRGTPHPEEEQERLQDLSQCKSNKTTWRLKRIYSRSDLLHLSPVQLHCNFLLVSAIHIVIGTATHSHRITCMVLQRLQWGQWTMSMNKAARFM